MAQGDSYFDDKHATLKADYVLANPPFNDGSKGENGWGADRVSDKDSRLTFGGHKLPLSPRNANTMWMLHFLSHLKDGGTAGFVMAAGELSSSHKPRLEVRQALIEQDLVDCVVQLSGKLFANTQVPCSLWFLSKNRGGTHGFRKRLGKILCIDARNLGSLIPGSRKQKQFSADDIDRIAGVYREFRRTREPNAQSGFSRVASMGEIGPRFALSVGRFVGSQAADAVDEPFEDRFPVLVSRLQQLFAKSARLQESIVKHLGAVADAE